MRFKRFLLIFIIVLITLACYLFMNRNYDPLARYNYPLTDEERELILTRLDERELKYIVDYYIAPAEYMEFIGNNSFNAYNIALYNHAKNNLYSINSYQVVTVVELIEKKNLDLDECLNKYAYWSYEDILSDLYNTK